MIIESSQEESKGKLVLEPPELKPENQNESSENNSTLNGSVDYVVSFCKHNKICV